MAVKVQANTTLAKGTLAESGCNQAICKAPNGTIWIAYIDTGVTVLADLLVAFSTDGGATWTEETVAADARIASSTITAVKTISIMVDSSNVPHIIFIGHNAGDTVAGRIRYVNRDGGSWGAIETIDAADASKNISNLSACIDSGDTFHLLADGDFTTAGLYYWTGTTGSWSAPQSIDGSGSSGDITVTSADLPVCIYNDSGGIKYNTRQGGAWGNEETVSTDTDNYPSNKIAIDSSDDIHVVWNQDSTGGLRDIRYRKRTSTVWGTELGVTDADTVDLDDYGFPLLSLDTSDTAYVIYQFDANTAQAETVWYKQIISEVVGAEQTLDSAILQPNGKPSVYAALWAAYPSSNILASSLSPTVVLLDENGVDADVYYESAVLAGEDAGEIAIKGTRFQYFDAFGTQRYIEGTIVA